MEISSSPSSETEKGRQLAALSYLWIFSVIILFARRENAFIQLHARQGAVLFILSLLLWPFPPARYLELLLLAIMVLGFIQAAVGNAYRIPVIGDLAEGHLARESWARAWHSLKNVLVRLVKPEHVTPPFEPPQGPFPPSEDLLHRIEDDEKKLQRLEDELHQVQAKIH